MSYRFEPGETLSEAFARTAAEQLAVAEGAPRTADGGDAGEETARGQARDAHALADDHDQAVPRRAVGLVATRAIADAGAVVGLIDHRRSELQAEALRIDARVYAESPKAFRRRLRAYWRAGAGTRGRAP